MRNDALGTTLKYPIYKAVVSLNNLRFIANYNNFEFLDNYCRAYKYLSTNLHSPIIKKIS